MGIIQSALNQTLGTIGIAARLSPNFEKKQELYKLEKEADVISKQGEAAALQGKDATDPSLMRNIGDIKKREMEIAEKKFQLDPTEQAFKESVQKQKSYRAFNEFESSVLEQRQKQAMQRVAEKQDVQQKQKRNFMSYLKKQPTSLGGTVGDLPESVQKSLAKNYSPQQRRSLMNQMDKENMNKDGK